MSKIMTVAPTDKDADDVTEPMQTTRRKPMDNASLLAVAMANQCRALIQKSEEAASDLPQALHPMHLLWMCQQIEDNAEELHPTKLHRWLGFVQCAMMANGMLDFEAAKTMFNEAKNAYGISDEDDDLVDHLDPASTFKLDIGGQG